MEEKKNNYRGEGKEENKRRNSRTRQEEVEEVQHVEQRVRLT